MSMEGAPGGYAGFLKTSRKYAFTSAASGDWTGDLPRMYPYRRLIIMSRGKNTLLSSYISRLQLDVNNGEKIIYAGRVAGWYDGMDSEVAQAQLVSETPATPALTVSKAGLSVGSYIQIPFDTADEMENCLVSSRYDRVTLTLTQIAANGDIRVVLQEVLP